MPVLQSELPLSCEDCGSGIFVTQNNPAKDDDVVTCAGCKREIGRFADLRDGALSAGKAVAAQITTNIFGKPPKWR